ncbi:hypothetical protein ACTMNS_13895, partial [Staphylococcus haemolyticus]
WLGAGAARDINPKPNNLDRRFRIYRETLSRFSCAASIVGPHATDLISEILGVKASEGTMNELSNIIQPHPSLSEAIGESADAYFGKAIHM